MKSKYNPFVPSIAIVVSLIAINTAQLASAAIGTWSGGASGTWDTRDINWTGLVAGTPWDATNGLTNTATFNTGSLAVTVDGPVFTNGITFSTSGTLSASTINLVGTTPSISVAIGQTGTISSTVAGSAGLVKSDAGVLTLSSASYTGGTTVNGGRLVLQNTFTGGRNYITNAELEVNITSDQTMTFGNPGGTISGTGNLIKTGSGNLRLTDFQGMQAIALTGASSIIDIQVGTISQFDARTPLLNNLAGMNIASGANFDIGNSSAFVDELTGAGSILKSQGGGSTLTVGVNNGSGTFTGTINTGMAFVKQGSGTQTLTNSNTYAGSTTISGGTLQVGGAGRLGNNASYGSTISIASGATLQFSTSVAQNFFGAITGLGGITKDTNTNDLTLSSTSNTYSGTTTVSAGRIIATAASHLSDGATSIVQSGVGQLFLQNAVTYSNPFNISGTGYLEGGDSQNNRSGAIRLGGGTLSGTITLSGNSRIATFGTGTNTVSGQITGGFGIEFYGFQNSNGAAPAFVLTNTANNYTGNTTIINSNYNTTNLTGVSTTLRLGASNVIPDGASAGNVAFAINGTNNNAIVALDLNGFNETINGLTVNAGTFATRIQNTAASGNSIITIGANDTTSSFSGTILDLGAGRTLAVTKIGSGNLTLSGTNTYIGATNVNAGTLSINGNQQAATGTLTVAAGATNATAVRLRGVGTVGGNTSFTADPDGAGAQVGGIHSPGNSVGKQTFDQTGSAVTSLTYNAGSIFEWELASTPAETVITVDLPGAYASNRGTAYDAVNVTGTLGGSDAIFRVVLDGSQNFSEGFWTANRAWTDIFRNGDGTGTSNVNYASIFGGGFQYYNYSGSGGTLAALSAPSVYGSFNITGSTLTWTAVPEPTTALAGLLLTAGLLRRRRGV